MSRIHTVISTAELERRWSAVRAAMRDQQIDALIMQNNSDWVGGTVKYFTDIPAMNAYPRTVIFYADDLMTIIENGPFDGRRVLNGNDPIHRGVGEILTTPAFLSIGYTNRFDGELAAQVLAKRGVRKIGLLTPGAMPYGFVQPLHEKLQAQIIDADELVDTIKAIKSDEEIALIKAATKLQDDMYALILRDISPGLRDVEIIAKADALGRTLGSEQGVILGGSAPLGQRSSFVGRHLQNRVIEPGDHFSLLIEVNGPGGFYCEIARTMVFGKASSALLDGFAVMKEAQDYTLSQLKPGAAPATIAANHDDFMRARNLPPEARIYAHGQGYDMVERPLIRRDETMALAAGMCLAVHPGYENDQQFSVICDNYLITETGASACLHETPKKVFELG